jgi:hypothetical protein
MNDKENIGDTIVVTKNNVIYKGILYGYHELTGHLFILENKQRFKPGIHVYQIKLEPNYSIQINTKMVLFEKDVFKPILKRKEYDVNFDLNLHEV